jgi:hypothetical protein
MNPVEQIPYTPPCAHETERVRAAIERAKRLANERDTKRNQQEVA